MKPRAKATKWSEAARIQLIAYTLQCNPFAHRGKHELAAVEWQKVATHLVTQRFFDQLTGDQCRDSLRKLIKKNITRRNSEATRTGAGAPLPRIAPTEESQEQLDRCTEACFPFWISLSYFYCHCCSCMRILKLLVEMLRRMNLVLCRKFVPASIVTLQSLLLLLCTQAVMRMRNEVAMMVYFRSWVCFFSCYFFFLNFIDRST